MPTFAYTARGVNGDITAGEIELPTRDDVVGYLRRQKLIPVKVEEKSAGINISFGSGIKTRDVVIFTRQFATMINSGLPLVQSLDILAKQSENKALRKDRKSTRLNSSHVKISYAVFCLKKKKKR